MAEVDICVVLKLVFIDFMGLCNYPTGMTVSVNVLSLAQWPARFGNRNFKYIGPECAIIVQTSDLAALPLQYAVVQIRLKTNNTQQFFTSTHFAFGLKTSNFANVCYFNPVWFKSYIICAFIYANQ